MRMMKKQLDLLDYSKAKNIDDIIRIGNENNRRTQKAYEAIYNDVLFKEWLYFTAGMKRWRIGPLQGYHPNRDRTEAVNFVIQELVGTDWRNNSHWGAAAGGAEHTFWGGEPDERT